MSAGHAARQTLLLLACILAALAAVVLAILAFTRFEDAPEQATPEEARRIEEEMERDAQLSAGLGVASAFSLLGAFAAGQAWLRGRSADRAADRA